MEPAAVVSKTPSPTIRHGITLALTIAIYAASIHFVYADLISPVFSYSGLAYRSPELSSYLGVVLLTIGVALLLPWRVRRPSDFIQWVLFGVASAPCMLISQYNPFISVGPAVQLAVIVAALTLLIRVCTVRDIRPSPTSRQWRPMPQVGRLMIAACLAVSVLNYLVVVSLNGLRFSYLSFADVYSVRSDFITSLAAFPLAGYLIPLQFAVINPVFIARGVRLRKPLWVTVGVAGQVLLYLTTGQKSVLFSVLGVATVMWGFRGRRTLSGATIMRSLIGLSLGAAAVDRLTGSLAFTTLFTRRFLIVPGVLATAYVVVFSTLPKTLFSEFLPTTNPYPAGTTPAKIVGAIFMGNSGTSANVSWLGHGYLSFGLIGMIIETVVIAVLLRLADAASRGLDLSTACAIFFMPTIALSSSSAFTAILTGAFGPALFVAWRLPREQATAHGEVDPPEKPSVQSSTSTRAVVPARMPPPPVIGVRTDPDWEGVLHTRKTVNS